MDYDKMIISSIIKSDIQKLDSIIGLDEKAIFAYELQALSRFLNEQTAYSPILISAIQEMKKRYPNSQYFKQFEPQIALIEDYVRTSEMHFDKAKFIETNYLRFEDLLKTLKGKNILVDVWATWCGPCIKDFDHKGILEPFVESGDLSILYISIDKLSWEKRWKENVAFNQLEGYHVLANKTLIQDMWNFLKGPEGVIPRYALIDKEGKIFIREAARPDHSEELVEQIKQLLVGNEE